MIMVCGLLFSQSTYPAIADTELFRTDLLIDAITTNDYELANSTLIKGHNPDPVDNYGRTPLIIAAMAGNPDLVELLAEHKAKLNRGDKAGGTALHYAARRGQLRVVRLLLDRGADPNSAMAGVPALHAAVASHAAAAHRLDYESPTYIPLVLPRAGLGRFSGFRRLVGGGFQRFEIIVSVVGVALAVLSKWYLHLLDRL